MSLTYAMVGGGIGAFIGEIHRKAIALDNTATLVAGALSSSSHPTTRTTRSPRPVSRPASMSSSTNQ